MRRMLVLTLVLVSCLVLFGARAATASDYTTELAALTYDASKVKTLGSSVSSVKGIGSVTLTALAAPTYTCGLGGSYKAYLAETTAGIGASHPLWVLFPGGGVGYYAAPGTYVPAKLEGSNKPLAKKKAMKAFLEHLADGKDADADVETLVYAQLAAGARVLMLDDCDHDLYAGLGTAYPNNPGQTVDGLPASLAIVDHVARPGGNWPTSKLYFHGISAGSVGAYAAALTLELRGTRINGLVLDSYVITSRIRQLFDAGCTLPAQAGVAFTSVADKIGAFVGDESWMLEHTLVDGAAPLSHIPLMVIYGDQDGHCCGSMTPISAAGGVNNCTWDYAPVGDAIATIAQPSHVFLPLAGEKHVLTKPDPVIVSVRTAFDAWFVIASATPDPVW